MKYALALLLSFFAIPAHASIEGMRVNYASGVVCDDEVSVRSFLTAAQVSRAQATSWLIANAQTNRTCGMVRDIRFTVIEVMDTITLNNTRYTLVKGQTDNGTILYAPITPLGTDA